MAFLENQFRGGTGPVGPSRNQPEGQLSASRGHKLGDLSQIQRQPTLVGSQESQLLYDPEAQILYTKGEDGSLV